MIEATNRQVAQLALSLLDLSDLGADCTKESIKKLCADAHTPYGSAAAICVWPRFVAEARRTLGPESAIRLATAVNFPGGDGAVAAVVAETKAAIAEGAEEIDLVIPYETLIQGDEQATRRMISAVRAVCPASIVLKAILETGALKDLALIRRASHIAIREGADFLKTSTGQSEVNDTLEAADVMLTCIRESGRRVGFKPSGDVRTFADAKLYLDLAITIHGPDWLMPSTFRLGASGLLESILAVIEASDAMRRTAVY
ncbi:deoxyribose-phosphate aldolase [Sinorhizobium numidicum]|uniref:Deoxyribose-phosphate aldolase n=1 Tax=Sinorhizobium numidicum TaxID=680248 RepID=A0ABY8CZV7_9HYPH|nr:deoxyribose-phosphate aldolase [Sinorhizobium numidicum]WEX77521.1 deoxyribose-phosphate aldolase [Sinorhizobium numidicum]WEX84181.1 deoxyribose-phosphate aldolase [Sinorhizobium numidicum]